MKMNAIHWPEGFVPGFTDNYCSNEVIVAGLTAEEIWPLLATPSLWPTYYKNSANARFYDNKGPILEQDVRFYFETFGFPVESRVTEYVAPSTDEAGRVSWHGWAGEEGAADRLDVLHAWLVENLPDNRVRILTQEAQNGNPAKDLAKAHPNPMINGHQDWLDGLVAAARAKKA
ncbi:MAG: SRPBCC domain-containing protein [Pantoea sp.]